VLFKHSDELREECRVCGKRFKDSTAVRAHERTHSDLRPYACPRCDKTFKTSECLWHHENRSKTCGKSLGELPPRPAGTRARRGRHRRAPAAHLPLPLPSANQRVDVEAVMAREMRNHHHHHQHLPSQHQQPAIYIGAMSPSSAQFVHEVLVAGGSPGQPQNGSDSQLYDREDSKSFLPSLVHSSAQFAKLTAGGSPNRAQDGGSCAAGLLVHSLEESVVRASAGSHLHHSEDDAVASPSSVQFTPTAAHHTASPDQPESGFVSFESLDPWTDMARPDHDHQPVVKVEAAEMMNLLDYNLAAFNPPTDSLQSSYPDVFDKIKVAAVAVVVVTLFNDNVVNCEATFGD